MEGQGLNERKSEDESRGVKDVDRTFEKDGLFLFFRKELEECATPCPRSVPSLS